MAKWIADRTMPGTGAEVEALWRELRWIGLDRRIAREDGDAVRIADLRIGLEADRALTAGERVEALTTFAVEALGASPITVRAHVERARDRIRRQGAVGPRRDRRARLERPRDL